MQFKKINLNIWYMSYLWHFFFFGHIFAPLMAITIIFKILRVEPFARSIDLSFMLFAIAIIFLYAVLLLIWKKATFRRSNFIMLAQEMGVNFLNKLYYYSLIEVIGVYSFARGVWNDVHVVAKMDLPFFAYSPWARISLGKLVDKRKVTMTGGDGPDFMKEESRIELFSLVSGPYDIDLAIKLTSVPTLNDVHRLTYEKSRLFFSNATF